MLALLNYQQEAMHACSSSPVELVMVLEMETQEEERNKLKRQTAEERRLAS